MPKGDCFERLSPFVNQCGVLRVGRCNNLSDESYASKHPVILPGKSTVVERMVRHHHLKVGHMGMNYLLSVLRELYWIIHGTVLVRKVSRVCIVCRKLSGRPGQTLMSALPYERVRVPISCYRHRLFCTYFGF